NSMSDLFHEDVSAKFIAQVGDIMRRADGTCSKSSPSAMDGCVSCCLVSFAGWLTFKTSRTESASKIDDTAFHGYAPFRKLPRQSGSCQSSPLIADLGQVDLRGIDWVIVGGESGPHARPMLRAWVVNVRRQCRTQRVLNRTGNVGGQLL